MKRRSASGAAPFDDDILATGTYLYSGNGAPLSSKIANLRHTQMVLGELEGKRLTRLLDVGCGDGEQTLTLLGLENVQILAIDPSVQAIDSARQRFGNEKRLSFMAGTVENLPQAERFDAVVIRSVLHHVDEPENLIKRVAALSDRLIVLEPNGLNPILKLIEVLSPYHRAHKERSFSRWKLQRWFNQSGFQVDKVAVGGLVPFFFPDFLAKLLHRMEPIVEKIWLLRWVLCGVQIFTCSVQSAHEKR